MTPRSCSCWGTGRWHLSAAPARPWACRSGLSVPSSRCLSWGLPLLQNVTFCSFCQKQWFRACRPWYSDVHDCIDSFWHPRTVLRLMTFFEHYWQFWQLCADLPWGWGEVENSWDAFLTLPQYLLRTEIVSNVGLSVPFHLNQMRKQG